MRRCVPCARVWAATLLGAFLTSHALGAQVAAESRDLRLPYDSGPVANHRAERAIVISKIVHVDDADWLRLRFLHVELAEDPESGEGALLRITSTLDGACQELDAQQVLQWQNSSAYFNGGTLLVEVEAPPSGRTSRVILAGVTASLVGGAKSLCGPTDDRVLSYDKRAARGVPSLCSAFMFDDCAHCFGTAGHCANYTLEVMQFNVPLSNPNGTMNHPPPEDQYAVDLTSLQFMYIDVGDDWAYFGVHPNSNTGLHPFQAQGEAYHLALPPPHDASHDIRITGYGFDTDTTLMRVQQTHAGPWVASSGSVLEYQADTYSGNSGSPVIHEPSGSVIGVHSHGGCDPLSGEGNRGTASSHPRWQDAIADPRGVCDPVAAASTYCTAKVNSQGCLPTIGAVGAPSASGVGEFRVQSARQLNQTNGLLIYGTLPTAVPFSGGFVCIGGVTRRTTGQGSGGSSTGSDCSGSFDFDMQALIASETDPNLVCGALVYTQYWSRDPGFLPPADVNLTAGLQFQIGH